MKKLLFAATLLLLLSVKPLFAGVAEGVDVKEVQRLLTRLCFNAGPIDGVWGKKTEKAAKEFLTSQSKEYSGTFEKKQATNLWIFTNEKELQAFYYPSKSELCPIYKKVVKCAQKNKTTQTMQKLNSRDAKFLQFGLIALGHMNGYIDGNWGDISSKALVSYLALSKHQISFDDIDTIKKQISKDLSQKDPGFISKSLRKNLQFRNKSKQELVNCIRPDDSISIADLKKNGTHGVHIAINKEINVDTDLSFGKNDKVFIIDSLINSQSRFRNEYEIKFSGKSLLGILNSASDSLKNKEAFLFTYTGDASAIHMNYKHDMRDPWQVSKTHRGEMEFWASTCNMTLIENSKTRLTCDSADEVMIEPLLPKGKYTVTLPSYKNVSKWESDPSLPWDVTIKNSYVKHIDFGISPGVSLTVLDTKKFQGGIVMCCSGSGKIEGLRANKVYKNRTWSVASDKGRAKLTLINSSVEGVWPTAWGKYKYEILDSDLIDPTLGSSASMKIIDSTFHNIWAKERARVTIINSRLTDPQSKRALVTATDSATIKITGLKGLRNDHLHIKGGGKIIID